MAGILEFGLIAMNASENWSPLRMSMVWAS